MFRNLMAEMVRKGITNTDLAKCIGVDERTIRTKLNGNSDFRWEQVRKIKHTFFSQIEIEYLFATDNQNKAS